tara:strand:- start:103822 stop:104280 length:459 start_codon:yes stop_codon:yes gene_type:complete
MVSQHLNRKIRNRLLIAHDIAMGENHSWEIISSICDGLDVMFATTKIDPDTRKPLFAHVSSHAQRLTGYWARELVGRDPKVLHTRATNTDEARKFMQTLADRGHAETRLINCRKNGDLYGCHILSCRAPRHDTSTKPIFFAFLADCAIGECL